MYDKQIQKKYNQLTTEMTKSHHSAYAWF